MNMKCRPETQESPADSSQVAPDRHLATGKLRGWWQSRRTRWFLIATFLLLALGTALEPLVSRQARIMIANWYASRAWSAFDNGDLSGALANCDRAVSWAPDDPLLYLLRGNLRFEQQDFDGSLADYNQVIALRPTFAGGYSGRSRVYQRQRRYDEAIRDLTNAIEHRPSWEPEPWNHRAYVRALAGIELEQALADVSQAIHLSPSDNGAYLDTRGLIQHKLGRHQQALADLERSIQLTIAQRDQWQRQARKEPGDPRRRARTSQSFDHRLAIMYQHRALVHAALGSHAQARLDEEKARQLGFDPDKGIE